ncbi:hypothetical protein [Pseudalkalibacillus caeni]|uniref:Phospholipid phosphatase n=1 Tax=Exobacillus caeni TaxID=2574798 RepID=A0A5R9EZS3_9BACL|nr:hypothetical protein [Pseudalkalibacillus caeni]TLS35959.1 hypothetical protein FCL54_17345 [Pseudalkalibacillus caeni]
MDTFLYTVFALSYLGLLLWGIYLAPSYGGSASGKVLLLVTAGLFYDNAIVASGKAIGKGSVLESLNLLRFWFHAILTPLLVVFSWYAIARASVTWAKTKLAWIITVVFTVILILLELFTKTLGIHLEPEITNGVLKYEPAASGGPPLMVILVTIPMAAAGIILWIRQRWGWMLIGVAFMALGGFIPIPIDSIAITNGFELILLLCLWTTETYQDRLVE